MRPGTLKPGAALPDRLVDLSVQLVGEMIHLASQVLVGRTKLVGEAEEVPVQLA